MPKKQILCLASLLLFACSDSDPSKSDTKPKQGQTSPAKLRAIEYKTTRDLAHAIFEGLKANQFSKLNQSFMDLGDMTYVSKQMIVYFSKKKMPKPQMERIELNVKRRIKQFPNNRSAKLKQLEVQFNQLRARVIQRGGNWSDIRFVGTHVENRRSRFGVPMLNLFITMQSQKKLFVLSTNNCLFSNRGWIIADDLKLEGSAAKK